MSNPTREFLAALNSSKEQDELKEELARVAIACKEAGMSAVQFGTAIHEAIHSFRGAILMDENFDYARLEARTMAQQDKQRDRIRKMFEETLNERMRRPTNNMVTGMSGRVIVWDEITEMERLRHNPLLMGMESLRYNPLLFNTCDAGIEPSDDQPFMSKGSKGTNSRRFFQQPEPHKRRKKR